MNTKQNHKCEYAAPQPGLGAAVSTCFEVNGQFWLDNGEYASTVNYCPFCGVKAPVQIDLALANSRMTRDEMSEMDKVQLEVAFRDMPGRVEYGVPPSRYQLWAY